ncbi:hypothetical protein LOSG293_020510 [Secundilactobacillus oryzae JCM 18671]|uniref:HTH marR-type domain-containing protein n=1 Tax=Secundilactobacillus oryzae JCM 18671 TaxID=1291743 RepID=A0A081BGE5_9LACO|nr:MarR family winged helix-turn-helix transcriptional regulator [Secundilactobacillus oryzae]GAK47113.1 hypothetical protein LOSG293_020510 [Secundilactobacillus oryzae JCM 18671]
MASQDSTEIQIHDGIQQLINLRRVVSAFSTHFLDEQNLSLNDLAIICELATEGAMTASSLAKKTGMQNSYVSTKISSMLKQKMITEHTVSGNRRLRIIGLTPAGKNVYKQIFAAFPEKYDEIRHQLDDVLEDK